MDAHRKHYSRKLGFCADGAGYEEKAFEINDRLEGMLWKCLSELENAIKESEETLNKLFGQVQEQYEGKPPDQASEPSSPATEPKQVA